MSDSSSSPNVPWTVPPAPGIVPSSPEIVMDDRWAHARNVLVVRLDNLGDVLLATPAFHAIKETQPETRLTLLASGVGAQVAELNPDLDDVIPFEAPWMDVPRSLPQEPEREQAMVRYLKERGFDGAIFFTSYHQSSLPAAYMAYLAGIPLRHAASVDFPGSLLTSRHRHSDKLVHEVERGLGLVGSIGYRAEHDDLVLQTSPMDRESMRRRLRDRGLNWERPLAIIHPGCSCHARTYPWEMYAEVADLMVEQLGAEVVLTGVQREREVVEAIRGRQRQRSISLGGETSFRELAAAISVADVVITNNTGPMHVAAALKTPTVALFALTNPPEQWGPWRVPHRMLNKPVRCALCYQFICPTDHGCLLGVSPAEVVQAVAQVWLETRK